MNLEKLKERINSNFGSSAFMKLFLESLQEEGIFSLSKDDLSRSLFNYYIDERFRNLFAEAMICKYRYEDKVDVEDAILNLLISGKLEYNFFNNLDINILNEDVEKDKKNFKTFVPNIKKMAHEYAVRHKIEKDSNVKLHIYAVDPNERQRYFLCAGKYGSEKHLWQLITDGSINSMTIKFPIEQSCMYPDPLERSYGITLKDAVEKEVYLNDASYTLVRGSINDEIKIAKLYTQSLDEEKLHKLSKLAEVDFANERQIEEKPYIYKKRI